MEESLSSYLIAVRPEDRHEINAYYELILACIQKRTDVPFGVVSRFIELLHDKEALDYINLSTQASTFAKKAYDRLFDGNHYDINWEYKDKQTGKKVKDTFNKILFELIFFFLLRQEKDNLKSKEKVISFFYNAIENDYVPNLLKASKTKLSTYKRHVIAGILTEIVWCKIINKKSPTNEEIYQATRNAIKSKKP